MGGVQSAPTHGELIRVFLKISLLGFGGPSAHLAIMLDEVVERRGWLTREHFLELMAVTNLLPGPNSSEVAIHVGYTQRGWTGALATGLAFLVPTFFMVTTLSWLYFASGSLPRVDALFWALEPAVLALIVWAGIRLGRTAVKGDTRNGGMLLWVLAAAGAVAAAVAGAWVVPVMLVGGAVTWFTRKRGEGDVVPASGSDEGEHPAPEDESRRSGLVLFPWAIASLQAAGAAMAGATGLLTVFWTHLWIGAVLFGGGYTLVVLLEPRAVDVYGWLTAEQFLHGVALTQAVPGPISTLSAFVGYAAAGVPGALLGTVGVYLPAFLAVLFVAPRLERLRSRAGVKAALAGVSAVVAGAILGVAARLAPGAIPDPWAGAVGVVALVALARLGVAAHWVVGGALAAGVVRALVG